MELTVTTKRGRVSRRRKQPRLFWSVEFYAKRGGIENNETVYIEAPNDEALILELAWPKLFAREPGFRHDGWMIDTVPESEVWELSRGECGTNWTGAA